MGVTGLWKLIEPTGKPVPLETLENKVLAVDISIWLHQVVKGFQDNKGNTLAHAHLLGLFHRLCKLLYYRIKPIFVFDGGIPTLKRETMAKRSQSKNKLLNEADRLQALLLQTLAKEKVVQQALGPNATEILKSPPKLLALQKDDKDDMFKLPDLPATIKKTSELEVSASSYLSDLPAAVNEKNRHAYVHNLQVVDVTDNQFKSLPPDVRHEILTDIKETRKQSSWGRLHELPTKSDDFSSFQMKRLLKRRQVQVCLEEAEKQMGGKSLTLNELQTFLTEEGVITAASAVASTSRQIASDENTRFLLVRDLKKAIEAAAKKEEDQCSQELSQESNENIQGTKNENDSNLGDEYDTDLQKAIQMSLECCSDSVYDDKDYECSEIKMSRNQRQLLKDAATSLAKAYLIEYGGMNEDEIKEMLEQTQRSQNEDDDSDELSASFDLQFNDKIILKGEMYSPHRHMKIASENELAKNTSMDLEFNDKKIIVTKTKDSKMVKEKTKESEFYDDIAFMSDSDDSDLVEVAEKEDQSPVKSILKNDEESQIKNKIQITIDLTQRLDKNNDIFADVFENEKKANFSGEEEHIKSIDSKMNKEHLKNLIEEKDKMENKTSKLDFVIATIDSNEEMKILDKSDIKLTKTEITKPEDILENLQKELENIKKVNSNDIDFKKNAEKEINGMPGKILNIDLLKIEKQNLEAKSILESLQEKITEVPKINLDDNKIDESLLISNLKEFPHSTEIQKPVEIIEIIDDDHTQHSTPSRQKVKQETISSYFETQYHIKRTPNKNKEEADNLQNTPKTKSPFFVRKSPRSSNKKIRGKPNVLDDSMSPMKREKVSKSLFNSPEDQTKKDNDGDITPIENPIEIAVNTLKENKSEQELKSIASDIAKEKRELERERNRQNRMGMSITDKMSHECMQLLKLFGIPYIVAPMEAEAQCAFLNAINLTDGTITDDSDIWLFGGRKVYKNFFNQQKHVLEFEVEKIEKLFNVDRKKLIQLAILVGSDYTTGITGIGAVTALEILATFPPTPFKKGETSEIASVLSSLKKFHEWWRNSKSTATGGKLALRGKLKNIEIMEGFPSIQVVEAYLNPKVDMSCEKFTWGTPDVETIREFTKKNLGWTKSKTDDILHPVLKKLSEKKIQTTLKNYFTVKSAVNVRELKVSKRVQKAIDKLSLDPDKAMLEKEANPKPTKTRTRKRAKVKTETVLASTSAADDECSTPNKKTELKKRKRRDKSVNNEMNVDVDVNSKIVPTPSNRTSKPQLKRLLAAGGPFTTDVIPQRERDLKEMQRKKERAAEVLRKAKEINNGKPK